MKLLSVSLLVVFAFAAGIVCNRAMFENPAESLASSDVVVGWPGAGDAKIVQAKGTEYAEPAAVTRAVQFLAQSEPATFDAEIAEGTAEAAGEAAADPRGPPQPETFDAEVADAPAEDGIELNLDPSQPATYLDEVAAPADTEPETTIDAAPYGRAVRIDSGDGDRVEADEIRVRSPSADSDNPIPEFLRGRDLPPLFAGQKVVTIQVPVDNWVDLGWGDVVRVERELLGVGMGGALARGTVSLESLAHVEIYALPQFAPEDGETVPVCLKVNTEQARELLKLRRTGTFKLTVVQPARDPLPLGPNGVSQPVPIGPHDDFALPPRNPEAAAEATSDAVPTNSSVRQRNSGSLPADDATPRPVAESTPENDPGVTFELEQNPPRTTRYEPLPEIEPSEGGTIFKMSKDGQYVVGVGQSIRLEYLPIKRVSGFDPRVIRVTADNQRRISVEGLRPGTTAIQVSSATNVFAPISVTIVVEGRPQPQESGIGPVPARAEHDFGKYKPRFLGDREQTNADSLPAIEPSEDGTVILLEPGLVQTMQTGGVVVIESEQPILRVSGHDARIIKVTAVSKWRLRVEALAEGRTAFRAYLDRGDSAVYIPPTAVQFTVNLSPVLMRPPPSTPRKPVPLSAPAATMLPSVKPPADASVQQLKDGGEYTVEENATLLVETPFPIATVDAFDQTIVGVAMSINKLKIRGIKAGETALVLTSDADHAKSMRVRVQVVRRGLAEFERTLKSLYPRAELQITAVREAIVIRGTVASDEESRQITELAGQYAPKVLNQLRVEQRHQSSRAIPEGMRVVAIQPINVEVIRGLQPGDVVDVLTPAPRERPGYAPPETVVSGLTVFGVDHTHNRGPVVSLLVTPDQVPLLTQPDKLLMIRMAARKADMEQPGAKSERTGEPATREVPIVVTNSAAELQDLTPGERVHVIRQTRPPLAAALGAVSEQLIVVDAKLVRAEIGNPKLGSDRVAILELTAEQAGAVVQSGEQPLTIRPARVRLSGSDSDWVNRIESAPTPQGKSESSLRSDIRALHDDVRKLIALLEHRLEGHTHPDVHEHDHGNAGQPDDAAPPEYYFPGPLVPSGDVPAKAADPAAEPVPAEAAPEAEPTTDAGPSSPSSAIDRATAKFLDRVWQFVGVRFTPIAGDAPQVRERFVRGGLLIDELRTNGPLANVKVRAGDVIIGVRKWETTDTAELKSALNQTSAEGVWDVEFHLVRDNERFSVHIPLQWSELVPPPIEPEVADAAVDAKGSQAAVPGNNAADFGEVFWNQFGIRVSPLRTEASQLQGTTYRGGLSIEEVRPAGPADKVGMRAGDVLVGLHVWETISNETLRFVLNHPTTQQGQPVKFYLLRGKETLYGRILVDGVRLPQNADAADERADAIETVAATPMGAGEPVTLLTHDAAARQAFNNRWGRAMLQRDYDFALGIAEMHRKADQGNPAYDQAAEDARAAKIAGSSTTPILVGVLARWCGPCRELEPLLKRMQNRGTAMVLLDADNDRELIQQLEIKSFPTLAWAVDGKKQSEVVGLISEERFFEFLKQAERLPNDRPQQPRTRTALLRFEPQNDAGLAAASEPSRSAARFRERMWREFGVRADAVVQMIPYRSGLFIDAVGTSCLVAGTGLKKGKALVVLDLWKTVDNPKLQSFLLEPGTHEGLPISVQLRSFGGPRSVIWTEPPAY